MFSFYLVLCWKKRKKKTVTTTNRQLLCRESQPQMYIIKLFAISFWYVMIPRTLRQPNSSSNHVLAQRIFPVSFVARGFAVSHVSIFYFCWSDFLCPFDLIQLISTWKPETKSHTQTKGRISRPNGETAAKICVSFVTHNKQIGKNMKRSQARELPSTFDMCNVPNQSHSTIFMNIFLIYFQLRLAWDYVSGFVNTITCHNVSPPEHTLHLIWSPSIIIRYIFKCNVNRLKTWTLLTNEHAHSCNHVAQLMYRTPFIECAMSTKRALRLTSKSISHPFAFVAM